MSIYNAQDQLRSIKEFYEYNGGYPPLEEDDGIECLGAYAIFPFSEFNKLNKAMFTPQALQTFIDLLAALPVPPGCVWFAGKNNGKINYREEQGLYLVWFARYKLRPETDEQWIQILQPFLDYIDEIPFLKLNLWPESFDNPVSYQKDAYVIRPDSTAFTRAHFFSGSIHYSCYDYHVRPDYGLTDEPGDKRLTGKALYHYLTQNNVKRFR